MGVVYYLLSHRSILLVGSIFETNYTRFRSDYIIIDPYIAHAVAATASIYLFIIMRVNNLCPNIAHRNFAYRIIYVHIYCSKLCNDGRNIWPFCVMKVIYRVISARFLYKELFYLVLTCRKTLINKPESGDIRFRFEFRMCLLSKSAA